MSMGIISTQKQKIRFDLCHSCMDNVDFQTHFIEHIKNDQLSNVTRKQRMQHLTQHTQTIFTNKLHTQIYMIYYFQTKTQNKAIYPAHTHQPHNNNPMSFVHSY